MATSGFLPSHPWVGPPAQFNGSNLLIGGDSCTSSLSYRAITLSSNVFDDSHWNSNTSNGLADSSFLQRSRTSINGMPPETRPTLSSPLQWWWS